jgi:hypothetical protein
MVYLLLSLGLALVVVAISYFLYRGLRDPDKVSWTYIAVGTSFFLLSCGWIIVSTIYHWGIIALIQIVFGSGAAFLLGVSLAFTLKRWRKVVGLIVAIGIPLSLCASFVVALPYSPDQVIRRNGEGILVKALNEYYISNKTYPNNLIELVPNYLSDLQEPDPTWGWLYTGNNRDFTLGYVFYVDKWGYTICKYSASLPKWDCPLDYSTRPFSLGPTPMP